MSRRLTPRSFRGLFVALSSRLPGLEDVTGIDPDLRARPPGDYPQRVRSQRASFAMHKIVDLALAVGAALAAIAPALADPQVSAECLQMDNLRAMANSYKRLADTFETRLREVVAEEDKYFARFDAEKTITLSGTVKELHFRAGSDTIARFAPPRAELILNVVNGEAQPAPWVIERSPLGWNSKTLTPGITITVTIHPLRDGSNGGQFLTATLPDGRQLDAGRPATALDPAEFLPTRLRSLRDQFAAADRAVAEFQRSGGCDR